MLFRAIDDGSADLVRESLRILLDPQPREPATQKILDEGFRLAVASRQSLDILEQLLKATPNPSLIEDTFNKLACQGSTPCTIRLLQSYVRRETLLEATRRHARSRYQDFYIVDILEEEACNAVLKAFDKRFSADSKGKAPLQKLLNQAWVNDIFLEEVRSDHRYIVQLLLHPINSGYLRPDRTTVGRGLMRALSRHTFAMASMLLESTECACASAHPLPMHIHIPFIDLPKGLRVNQDDLDRAFHVSIHDQDVYVVDWLVHTHNMLVSIPVLEQYYVIYVAENNGRNGGEVAYVRSILDRLVSLEYKEKIHLARERRRRIQMQLNRLASVVSPDIHVFSSTTVQDTADTSGSASGGDSRQTLNRAIRQYLTQQVPAHLIDPAAALHTVLSLLPTLFPSASEQERAERILSEGLTTESLQLLAMTVAYLQIIHTPTSTPTLLPPSTSFTSSPSTPTH
ncbi:hypothetical protein EON64_06805, partial [archaeon]